MCIQKTTYSCRHTHFQQLPCDNPKKVKKSYFSFGSAKRVPCVGRYEWNLKEPCLKCRRFPLESISSEELRGPQERGSRGASKEVPASRHYAVPQPVGGIYAQRDDSPQPQPRRYGTPQPVGGIYAIQDEYAIPKPVGGIYPVEDSPVQTVGAQRPDSYYEPGLHAEVTNLSGHYETSTPVQVTGAPRPDSYYESEVNADVTNLPGHYDVSAPAHHAVPSQLSRQNLSVTSPDRTHQDGEVSPGTFIPLSTYDADFEAYSRFYEHYYQDSRRCKTGKSVAAKVWDHSLNR